MDRAQSLGVFDGIFDPLRDRGLCALLSIPDSLYVTDCNKP